MARTFASGTATDGGGSATVNAATVQSAIRDAVLLNAAWSLVEEFTGTGGTIHNVVLKCASASSGLPKDFYLLITRTTGGATLSFYTGEDYNATTHVLSNVCPLATGSSRVVDVNGLVSASAPTVDVSATQTLSNTPNQLTFACAASTFWAVITDVDHTVIAMTTASPSVFSMLSGAFTSLVQGYSDPMPVCQIQLNGTAGAGVSSHSSTTRHPVNAAATLAANPFVIDDGCIGSSNTGFIPGATLNFTSSDKMQNALPHAYEFPVKYVASNATNSGWLRGKLKKMALVYGQPAGTAVGDTFTMNGTTWMVVATSGSTYCIICDEGA